MRLFPEVPRAVYAPKTQGGKLMLCAYCGETQFVTGNLEGITFKPSTAQSNTNTSNRVYGINTRVCRNCGKLHSLCVNPEELQKVFPAEQHSFPGF